jgi:hypothetical protein
LGQDDETASTPIGMSHHCQLVFILSVSLLIMDKESPVCKKIMLE